MQIWTEFSSLMLVSLKVPLAGRLRPVQKIIWARPKESGISQKSWLPYTAVKLFIYFFLTDLPCSVPILWIYLIKLLGCLQFVYLNNVRPNKIIIIIIYDLIFLFKLHRIGVEPTLKRLWVVCLIRSANSAFKIREKSSLFKLFLSPDLKKNKLGTA